MKNLIQLFVVIFISTQFSNAQTDVNLEINHTLNSSTSVMNTIEVNNLNQEFKITRLQYYVTGISVIHDGAQVLPISLDTVALINVSNEQTTTIPLGNLNVSSIEGVKFNIGVYAPVNNENPAQWPAGHPLAPQNPSMHWGWASGYRFVAFEGTAGNNFSQLWQFHGLGNGNYFEIDPVMVPSENIAGVETIKVEANYVNALKDLSISQGLISHGETGEAREVLLNFQSDVFGVTPSASINEYFANDVIIFPNPTNDNLSVTNLENVEKIELFTSNGKLVTSNFTSQSINLNLRLEETGIYFLKLYSFDGSVVTKKVVRN